MAFELRERKTLHLDILNGHFDIKCDAEMFDRVQRVGKRLIDYGKDPATENDSVKDSFDFACDCIDDLLGYGASDSIFAGITADVLDAYDVITYIGNEIKNANQNREQRRANTKAQGVGKKKRRYKGNHK